MSQAYFDPSSLRKDEMATKGMYEFSYKVHLLSDDWSKFFIYLQISTLLHMTVKRFSTWTNIVELLV